MIGINIGIPMLQSRRSGYSSQAQQFFDRAPALTAKNDKDHYASIIDALVLTGIWERMDYIHLFSGARQGDVPLQAIANLNLINANFTATPINPYGFDNGGYFGDGVSSYIDTGFNPLQDGVNFQRDSAHYAVWNLASQFANATALTGAQDISGSSVSIYPFSAPGGRFVSAINDKFNAGVSVGSSLGMRAGDRSSSLTRHSYIDGVEYEDYPDSPSQMPPDLNIFILASNVNGSPLGFTDNYVSFDGAGGSLTAQQHVMLYQIIRSHLFWTGALYT